MLYYFSYLWKFGLSKKEQYWLLLLNWKWEQWSNKDKSTSKSEPLELPERKAWGSEQFCSEYSQDSATSFHPDNISNINSMFNKALKFKVLNVQTLC